MTAGLQFLWHNRPALVQRQPILIFEDFRQPDPLGGELEPGIFFLPVV